MNVRTNPTHGDNWSEYWQGSDAHACTREFSPDARDRIAAKWVGHFNRLENGHRVLDLATGNGALITYLPQSLPSHVNEIEAVGVDMAAIEETAPRFCPKDDRLAVEFHGGVDISDLSFGDGEFDLVTSQYGIEYADLADAFKEACRVTRERLVFLIHAKDGVVVRQNTDIVRQVKLILDEIGMIALARQYQKKPDEKCRLHVDQAFEKIQQEIGRVENPSFLLTIQQQVKNLFRGLHSYPEASVKAVIDMYEQHLVTHSDRMAALGEAARSKAELEDFLRGRLPDWMQACDIEPEYSDGDAHLVGYWLHAWRAEKD